MKWMRERDLLIAQTMAFVQSVTGKKPDAEPRAVYTAPPNDLPGLPAARPLPDIEAILAEAIGSPEPPKPIHVARLPGRSAYQTEIQARVESFRAHQARVSREREEYCQNTMAKVQASLKDTPSRLGK